MVAPKTIAQTAARAAEMPDLDAKPSAAVDVFREQPGIIRSLHIRWAGPEFHLESWDILPRAITREERGRLRLSTLSQSAQLNAGCDVVVLEIPAFPFQESFFPHRNALKNLGELPHALQLGWGYALLLRLVSRLSRPLLIFDFQDSAGIAARFLPLIRRAVAYHKRELPRFPASAFLHTEHFAIEPWRNRNRYAAEITKLRPLSFGALCPDLSPQNLEKDIDVLWGGTVENSPVRERGVRLLRELASQGMRIRILDQPVEKDEFLRLMERSWLTFCPDGNGWQCYRAFEAAMLGSVPLLSAPTIWQDEPFQHGVHCFYYNPDGDDLLHVVKDALSQPARLQAMTAAIGDWVRATHSAGAVYHRHLSAWTHSRGAQPIAAPAE